MPDSTPILALTRRENTVIIDCHGHYTTAPKGLQAWRDGSSRR